MIAPPSPCGGVRSRFDFDSMTTNGHAFKSGLWEDIYL